MHAFEQAHDLETGISKMKKKTTIYILLLFGLLTQVQGQTQNRYYDVWFFLNNTFEINHKWSINNETHWRGTRFFLEPEQLLIRPSVNFHLNEFMTTTVGYTYIRSFPNGTTSLPHAKPEHNVWEQITLSHPINKFKFSHRFRMEHRFQGSLKTTDAEHYQVDGYTFSNRFRYRVTMKRKVAKRVFIAAFDEIWLSMNKYFQYPGFDRNWFYAGAGYEVFQGANVQLGFLHQYVQVKDGQYDNRPTLQLTFQFDFKRNKSL